MKKVHVFVHLMTRLQTWDSFPKKILALYVLPWIIDDAKAVSDIARAAVKLDFVPTPLHPKGTILFDDEPWFWTVVESLCPISDMVGATATR